tara:strand:+ start:1048 stop:1401 length:354 start_codon:yes stop_codon:yes gene_type:complete
MQAYIILGLSIALNLLLIWYVIKLLQKLMFVSENMSDLFMTSRAFQVFIKELHAMQSYFGEPIIQELMVRVGEITQELEAFRDVFEYTLDDELDQELEEALNGEEEEEKKPLFYAGP